MSRPDPLPWPEVDAALAVIKHALDAGQIGNAGLLSSEQANFKGMWEEAYQAAYHYGAVGLGDMDLILARQPQPGPIRMINTTSPHQLGES